MNTKIKERYKYTDIQSILGMQTMKTKASININADHDFIDQANEISMSQIQSDILEDPIIAQNISDKDASGARICIPKNHSAKGILTIDASYPSSEGLSVVRNIIEMENGSSAKIIIDHHTAHSSESMINSLIYVKLGANANLEIVELADTSANILSNLIVSQERDSKLNIYTIDLNNKIVVRNQDISLKQTGAECSLNGLYLTSDQEHCDNRILVRHLNSNCLSNQNFKGIMGGRSIASFTGSIYVEKDAQKTEAYQQNNNVILDDKAKVYTRPQLEIYADDVKCNHGATVGKLDAEAIYYMRQRGISTDAARRLQISGFAQQVLNFEAMGEYRDIILDKVSRRLDTI